jgi:hypothetical protein
MSELNSSAGRDCELFWSNEVSEIPNHKYQTNHNDQSACGGPNLFFVMVIEYWNLRFVCNLVLEI